MLLFPERNVSVPTAKSLQLACVAAASPEHPEIKWTREGGQEINTSMCDSNAVNCVRFREQRTIINESRVTVSVLEFCSIDTRSTGDYQCVVDTNTTYTASIKVTGNTINTCNII